MKNKVCWAVCCPPRGIYPQVGSVHKNRAGAQWVVDDATGKGINFRVVKVELLPRRAEKVAHYKKLLKLEDGDEIRDFINVEPYSAEEKASILAGYLKEVSFPRLLHGRL